MTADLRERHREEIEFHDNKVARCATAQKKDFYAVDGTNLAYLRMMELAGDLRGKRVLDFGCGEGWAAAEFVSRGAELVVSFDISEESLRSASRNIAGRDKSRQIVFLRCAAECLPLSAGSFDLVLGNAILHHTDLEQTMGEVCRVLRPGGRALFVEPLGHNPVLAILRKLTPWRRSKYESPLRLSQVRAAASRFRTIRYEGYFLLAGLALGAFWLHRNARLLTSSLRVLNAIDQRLMSVAPGLVRYCFAAVIVFEN